MAEVKKNNFYQKLVSNIKDGDKIMWIIVISLMLFSLVAIFSSTSSQAIRTGTSRTVFFYEQALLVISGLAVLILLTSIPNIKYIRGFSQLGFAASLFFLTIIVGNISLGPNFRAVNANEAVRAINIHGFTLQVYEVVKVAMVMYLAWAMQTYEAGKFWIANKLGTSFPQVFGWMKKASAQLWLYIFIPMLITISLTFFGSTSSALMLAIVCGITLWIGGLKIKDLLSLVVVGVVGVMLLVGAHIASNGEMISRMQTAFNRLSIELPYPSSEARAAQKKKIDAKKLDPGATFDVNSAEFARYRDKTLQNESAEVAFVQGGRRILGKGPGKSTQKYIVPLIFEDYMFSLLMEEYGMLGCFIIIIMYLSLFARGVILVQNCNARYAKTCVGGLVFLITFQAMFHILINCNVGILTGQTLPLVSHGRSSFLCFIIGYGVILNISKQANQKIKKESLEQRRAYEESLVADQVSQTSQN